MARPAPLSQGLAAFAAGLGPAGHDPDDEPTDKVVQTPVAAIKFDPFDRKWSQNDDFTMVASTPAIQRAATLMLPLGSISAVARSGFDDRRVRRTPPSQRMHVIRDELSIAWKSLLQTGLIKMGAITLSNTTPWDGRFHVEVTDLETGADRTLEGKT